jgi:hypothetical protein
MSNLNSSRSPEVQQQLPEQGGLLWVAGGVPPKNLPEPCFRCLQFLSQLTDEELAAFLRRVREQTRLQPGEDRSLKV